MNKTFIARTTISSLLLGSALLLAPVVARADFSDGHHDDNHWHDRDHDHDGHWGRNNDSNDYWYAPRYDRRANNVVSQGIRSGRLTPDEVREIDRDQARVNKDAARARSDGYVSQGERDRIQRDQNELNHDLSHELNDGERRW